MTPAMARRGLDYYLEHRAWDPELRIDLEGLQTVIEVYAEQAGIAGRLPSPEKYVDSTYVTAAMKELGWR